MHAERLQSLDGLRGVAALLVVVHHFTSRWAVPQYPTTLYPHGDLTPYFPPLALMGEYGVLLFFLISGFVILMTLERTAGLPQFAVRRVARLWPAMLVLATLSALVQNLGGIPRLFPQVSGWEVTTFEYLASVVFLPPRELGLALGVPGDHAWVEGVYWTLWAEVRFYAAVGLAYLLAGRRHFVGVWIVIQSLSTGLALAAAAGIASGRELRVLDLPLQHEHLSWFTLGLCGWLSWTGRAGRQVFGLAALATAAIASTGIVTLDQGSIALGPDAARRALLYAAVVAPFALFLARSPLVEFLAWRGLVAIGMASYPLYLFHERVGMIIIGHLGQAGWPGAASVTAAFAFVVATALLVHRLVEQKGRRLIERALSGPAQRSLERHHWLRFAG